jgi:hypothetical protein
MVASGTSLGQGTRMIQAFRLDASAMNTQVNIASDSTTISLAVDLHDLRSPLVPANARHLLIDWSGLTTTAKGQRFDPSQITQVRVGKYSQSLAELEQQHDFSNLATLADELYSAKLDSHAPFDLALAQDAQGKAFSGIDTSGTWLVALDCGNCGDLAPWYMTVLTACTPDQADCPNAGFDTCVAVCGDGVVSGDEQCDQGAENDGSYGGCNPDCTLAPHCGDGVVQSTEGETCDPPSPDRCTATCQEL